jgi:hypothetical protein
MRLRQRNTGKEDNGTERIDDEMHGSELALGQRRVGAVKQPEQHHRGEADQIDVCVQMRLLKVLVDADPNAESEAEQAVQQANQNEPAIDIAHAFLPERTISKGIGLSPIRLQYLAPGVKNARDHTRV